MTKLLVAISSFANVPKSEVTHQKVPVSVTSDVKANFIYLHQWYQIKITFKKKAKAG